MPVSPRLALPLISAGQTQKDVTHNDAVLAIDRMLALTVVSRRALSPPAAPAIGSCYIVPAGGASAWSQPADTLVQFQGDGGWLRLSPADGQTALVMDEAIMIVFRGGWQAHWPVAGLRIGGRTLLAAAPATIGPPTGGVNVDSEARSSLTALILALRDLGLLAP